MIDKAQATQRLDAIEREAAELRMDALEPEPELGVADECWWINAHGIEFGSFTSRSDLSLGLTFPYTDEGKRRAQQRVAQLKVTKQGKPPFRDDENMRLWQDCRWLNRDWNSEPWQVAAWSQGRIVRPGEDTPEYTDLLELAWGVKE